MKRNSHFLSAEWNNLIMANYVVPKEILLPFVPHKTELDFYKGRNLYKSCWIYVSEYKYQRIECSLSYQF